MSHYHYDVGTVARVRLQDEICLAFRYCAGSTWMVQRPGKGFSSHHQRDLGDITPLVCIEATREDADLIDALLRDWPTPGAHGLAYGVVNKLRCAIREQTPEPEPPKRWTVSGHLPSGQDDPIFWLYDNNRCTEVRGITSAGMQSIADRLNAAEPPR